MTSRISHPYLPASMVFLCMFAPSSVAKSDAPSGRTKEGGTTHKDEFNIYRARLEVVPKMGVMFTF